MKYHIPKSIAIHLNEDLNIYKKEIEKACNDLIETGDSIIASKIANEYIVAKANNNLFFLAIPCNITCSHKCETFYDSVHKEIDERYIIKHKLIKLGNI